MCQHSRLYFPCFFLTACRLVDVGLKPFLLWTCKAVNVRINQPDDDWRTYLALSSHPPPQASSLISVVHKHGLKAQTNIQSSQVPFGPLTYRTGGSFPTFMADTPAASRQPVVTLPVSAHTFCRTEEDSVLTSIPAGLRGFTAWLNGIHYISTSWYSL